MKISPLLQGDQLPLDFTKGFGVVFEHGKGRVSAALECMHMKHFYRSFYGKTEEEQRKVLFSSFSAPQNKGLLTEHAEELYGRVVAYKVAAKEAASAELGDGEGSE